MAVFQPIDTRPAPARERGVVKWLRENLFSSWISGALTVVALYLLAMLIPPILDWALFEATVSGTDQSACDRSDGACWTFVKMRLEFFLYGFYPAEERWRVTIFFFLFLACFAPQFFAGFQYKKQLGIFSATGFPVISYFLLSGGALGLPVVETSQWGGLFLTMVIAYVGIVFSLPLGILLALGRQSNLPFIKAVCTVFIEVWRGVPLISILFMSSVMLPLFLPDGVNFDKLLRALIGIVLFEAALLAEVVRGGLQALPKGQYEASAALGLNYWKSMRLIVLPQSLKLVIPGIVNVFIQLAKDTTLVIIIGLFDVLNTVQSSIVDPAWKRVAIEGYVFTAFCFWVICFGLSRYSRDLERKLDTGHRS